MRIFKIAVCSTLFFATMCLPLQAQTETQREIEDSCRNFVQTFYDWYARGLAASHPDLLERAIKYKRSAFSVELLRQIKDSKERAWANEEVWLDFEPILNTQNPGQGYVAGAVNLRSADTCLVDIHATFAGKKKMKPTVVPELTLKDGQWFFVNFHYPNSNHPDNESLVRMLEKIMKGAIQPKSLASTTAELISL